MPQYKISCNWEVYGTAYIDADNLKQAIEKAKEDDFPLPTDNYFIDGSFEIDMQSTITLNNLDTIHDILNREYNLEPIHCINCGSTEVTFNQAVGDALCADCGEWQLEFANKTE